jgi:antitoxin (DNA-binding transcriptional repressor) of toxin-antitoxin stability system
MQTLTITHAKKNLGKWLKAAARGEDIAIVSGADIIALRKVPIEASDYAQREYGVTEEQLDRFVGVMDAEIERHRAAGDLEKYRFTSEQLREKIAHHSTRRPGKNRRSA